MHKTRRVVSDTPQLIPDHVAAACAALAHRIHERFPGRGIDRHAQWFSGYVAALIADGPLRLRRWLQWIVSGAGALIAFIVIFSPIFLFVRRMDVFEDLPTYLQSLDAFITLLAAAVAGRVTWVAYVGYRERQAVIPRLNALRSFAHVTDMLQLAKCPCECSFPHRQRPAGVTIIRTRLR